MQRAVERSRERVPGGRIDRAGDRRGVCAEQARCRCSRPGDPPVPVRVDAGSEACGAPESCGDLMAGEDRGQQLIDGHVAARERVLGERGGDGEDVRHGMAADVLVPLIELENAGRGGVEEGACLDGDPASGPERPGRTCVGEGPTQRSELGCAGSRDGHAEGVEQDEIEGIADRRLDRPDIEVGDERAEFSETRSHRRVPPLGLRSRAPTAERGRLLGFYCEIMSSIPTTHYPILKFTTHPIGGEKCEPDGPTAQRPKIRVLTDRSPGQGPQSLQDDALLYE